MSASADEEVLPTHEYFRVDCQGFLPAKELARRHAIKEKLEKQYMHWINHEQHRWSTLSQPRVVSFLGLSDWTTLLPDIKSYVNGQKTSFALLSELQLSTISSKVLRSHESRSDHRWLYEQYRRFAINVYDLEAVTKHYRIPLIDATVAVGNHPMLFEDADPNTVAKMLPPPTSSCRMIKFPQTRFSFLEDKIFHGLYPHPEEQVEIMFSKLRAYFEGPLGYYNALATPFTDYFEETSYDGQDFSFLAALYPIVDFEFPTDYKSRKISERLVAHVRQQKVENYPKICQWKYSRKFSFARENKGWAESSLFQNHIQSARGLFEYSCADVDTLSLELRQTPSIEAEPSDHADQYLLQVDPLWLIVFPNSDAICVFRNERSVPVNEPVKDLNLGTTERKNIWLVLLRLIDTMDRSMGSYEPRYRKRLAKLQFRIYDFDRRDNELLKSLSEFVAELTILLDPLQAQIDLIRKWRQLSFRGPRYDLKLSIDDTFGESISRRVHHLDSLKRLQERARQSQELLFQLSNSETAYQQSQLAKKMFEETSHQLELARKAGRQNKAILIFTIITVIFLPLSFFTSYFGMNTSDIRSMNGGQKVFWSIAGPLSFATIGIAMIFAFRANLSQRFKSQKGSQKTSSTTSDIGLEGSKQA